MTDSYELLKKWLYRYVQGQAGQGWVEQGKGKRGEGKRGKGKWGESKQGKVEGGRAREGWPAKFPSFIIILQTFTIFFQERYPPILVFSEGL